MVLMESESLALGQSAIDFELEGVDGDRYSLTSFSEAKALVIVFMCNHCPYVQRIWGGLVALQEKFVEEKVQFVGINPNTANVEYEEEDMGKMKEYYEKYQMNFPYLEDADQSIAKAYKAQCTPDIYLYNADRKLVYHGRIDEGELESAIQEVLRGAEPLSQQKPSIGCSIKWV